MEYKDCKTCPGYCCYYTDTIGTPLIESDITRIAEHLEIPREQFISKYVTLLKGGNIRYRAAPDAVGKIKGIKTTDSKKCPFLRRSACFIHSVKPKFCSDMTPVHIGGGVPCREWHRVKVGASEK